MARIDFRDLTKIFPGGTRAVDALDLEIGDGEFMVVVGPSGSGKTTVLRIAAGLDKATSGEVWIGEELVNDVPPMDRNIAMVFQSYALYPHMTVYENMAFGLKLHGLKKKEIEPRVSSAAQMLGIDDLLKRKPAQLSGGQRQRVAMGRAIVREPDAFLMDEPLSNLDAKLRVEMRAYLATLHQRLQTTTLYVTHDQTEAMEDASLVPSANGSSLDVDVSLAEPMGAELIAHFPLDARPITGATAHAVAADDAGPGDSATLALLVGASTSEAMITARLSPRSGAQTGQPLRVAVDAQRMHFFDPETEASIW